MNKQQCIDTIKKVLSEEVDIDAKERDDFNAISALAYLGVGLKKHRIFIEGYNDDGDCPIYYFHEDEEGFLTKKYFAYVVVRNYGTSSTIDIVDLLIGEILCYRNYYI